MIKNRQTTAEWNKAIDAIVYRWALVQRSAVLVALWKRLDDRRRYTIPPPRDEVLRINHIGKNILAFELMMNTVSVTQAPIELKSDYPKRDFMYAVMYGVPIGGYTEAQIAAEKERVANLKKPNPIFL